jgi:PAS domain S-box-containing protein
MKTEKVASFHKQTEEAFSKNEENYRSLFEQSNDAIIIHDFKGQIIDINQRASQLLAYDREQLLSMTISMIHPESEFATSKKAFQETQKNGHARFESRLIKSDGSLVDVEISSRITDDNKEIIQGIIRDITERKQSEAALKESESRFRALFENMIDGIAVYKAINNGEDFNFVDFNESAEKISKVTRDDVIDQSVLKIFPAVKDFGLFEVFQRVWKTGKPEHHPITKYKDDRISHWGENSVYKLPSGEIVAVYSDETERKQAEESLKESENRYRILTENVADGVCILQDRKLVFLNPAFASILGYTREELTEIDPIVLFHEDYKNRLMTLTKALEKGADVLDFQAVCIQKDRREIWVEARHNIVQWKDKPAFLFTIRDITETKLREMAAEEDREQLQRENIKLRASIKDRYKFGNIIGKSPAMQEVYELILKAGASDINVVILGESGTGKELVAKAIHETSVRADKIFVPVNCGAIPENLAETELFGHRKGAFTGAHIDKNGYLHTASSGTLFLDEVAELEPNMQVKLLRAIETGEYTPVGDTRPRKSDLRIISATNRDLSEMIAKGLMREDFYYRISIIPITLPPLRERKQDIPLLVEHFIKLHSNGKKYPIISGTTMKALIDYDWPGNVRELQSMIQRYLAVGYFHFLKSHNQTDRFKDRIDFNPDGDVIDLRQSIEQCEKRSIFNALHKYQWQRGETAAALGIDPKTLYSKIKKFGFYRDYRAIMPDLN